MKRNTDGIAMAKVEYMKDGPEGDEISFRLEQVELGSDEDGEAITSCVVVEADAPATGTATHPKLGKNEQSMLDILADHMPNGLTKHEWNELAREDGIGVKRRADLADCRRRLKRKKLVHEAQDGRWFITTR